MAEVYRPDVLSFRPVPESELSDSPQVHHGFLPKLSPHSGKNIKRLSAHGRIGTTHLLFYVFARRRGDFAEMMGVRGEARGACSPELTSSQTSRHAVPTASTGVFSVFFNIAGGGSLYQRAEVMKPASAHDGAAQQGNTFGRITGSSGGY